MFVLGIETTCDETACAVVRDGQEILSNVIHSQTDLHQKYGGVFPEVASRSHVDTMIPVVQEALSEAGITKPDLIAVARGPGLIGSLLVGLTTAKALSLAWEVPFLGVSHIEAHLYAAMMGQERRFPALGVVVSGGHTSLIKIHSIGNYEPIGTTADDAVGEAFDKVAAMLQLPYPGGPAIEQLAQQGDPLRYPFKPGKIKLRPWDFSFSGLKTSVLYALKEVDLEQEKAHIAASFQRAALTAIVEKTAAAAATFDCQAIYFGGGVSNNQKLRELMKAACPNIPIFWPPAGLSLDNGAMIAGLGYHLFTERGSGDPLTLEPLTRLPLL